MYSNCQRDFVLCSKNMLVEDLYAVDIECKSLNASIDNGLEADLTL